VVELRGGGALTPMDEKREIFPSKVMKKKAAGRGTGQRGRGRKAVVLGFDDESQKKRV